MENLSDKLVQNGYLILKNCVSKQLVKEFQNQVNIELDKINHNKKNKKSSLSLKLNKAMRNKKLHDIQVAIGERINNEGLVRSLLNEKKISQFLHTVLGPDLEFCCNSGLAINKKLNNDSYYLKDYHQEIWSGSSLSSLLFWVPIFCKKNSGTIEVVPESHKWGHIPHKNRKPISLPAKMNRKIIEIEEGSVLVMTPLTLHRSVPHTLEDPRVAHPFNVRNMYYPKTGNEDLWEFKKVKLTYYSKFRKILGNPQLTPFRTVDQKRDIF